MTRDDIINLAREAGCEETWGADAFRFGEVELERFVAIIAAAEREACAKVADDKSMYFQTEAQKAERDDVSGILSTAWHIKVCAAAIRARGNT